MLWTSSRAMCPADREALRLAPPEIGLLRTTVESARQGVAGPVEDFRLAERLSDAHLIVCPGEGHFLLAGRVPDILSALEFTTQGRCTDYAQ